MASDRPIVFGEVLYDRFPDGNVVLGGAPFNVAWHLQAFGQEPLFISRVGDDILGGRIRDAMRSWGMDTSGLQLDPAHPTGTVEVELRGGEPVYDIIDGRAYDFVEAGALPPLDRVSLVYHGSLALRGEVSRTTFEALTSRVDAPRFLDVNLRDPWWRRQAVVDMIQSATWVKLNERELDLLQSDPGDAASAARRMVEECRLEALILTRGAEGAELHGPDASHAIAPAPAAHVVDTVGAGDGFASVILLGLLNDWPLQTSIERAQQFASAIVGVRGATVDDANFYAGFTTQWARSAN